MAYDICIGNAKPYHHKEDGELTAGWDVETIRRNDAPTFKNDDLTKNSNCRSPAYSVWDDFLTQTGLKSLFMDNDHGLMREHPGCFMFGLSHLHTVQNALQQWKKKRSQPLEPGFEPMFPKEGEVIEPCDPILARLIWLEWWMRWTLENCETPAIQNS